MIENSLRSSTRVLVADDSEDALGAYEAYLSLQGYKVLVSTRGDDALSRAREALPDAVIVDFEMPGLNGCELAEALAMQAATRNIPVIMVSARGDSQTRTTALRSGCAAFVTKPCSPAALLSLLADLLHLA
jgi:DNA-binding response OmpR family regulator